MKGLIVFLFFLVSGCPLNKVKSNRTVRTTTTTEKEATYEMPPHAPIPPENYCYELHQGSNGQDITRLQLTVTLDSVIGKLSHIPPRPDEPDGMLVGTIYENILLVNYQCVVQGKSKTEDQEWKISGDSIYRKITQIIKRDSTQAGAKDSDRIVFTPALHKAPCI